MLSAFVFFVLATSYMVGTGDFIEFYIATRRLISGLNPYNAAFYPKGYFFGFPYPPLAIDLALPVSHLLFPVAVRSWDILCLLAYLATVYWWTEMLWKRLPSFPEFARITVALAIPPCVLTFWFHNVNLLVLFFGTAASHLIWKGKSSFWAGFLAGGLLIKPHLTLIPLLELLRQSRNRVSFLSGVLLITFLSIVPFMNTLQPPGALVRMYRSAQDYGRLSYYADEQSAAFLLYKAGGHFRSPSLIMGPSEMAGQPVGAAATGGFLIVKALGLGLALLLWFYMVQMTEIGHGPWGLIVAFSLNLLGAVYSHTYDSIFLMPLMAGGLYGLSRRFHLSTLAGFSFVSTLLVLEWSLAGGLNGGLNWNRASWISLAYVSLGFSLLAITTHESVPETTV